MKNASDYLAHVKALITLNRQVVHWEVIREEAQGDVGLLRYRLALRDGGLLEMFERFQVVGGRLQVTKYSYGTFWHVSKQKTNDQFCHQFHELTRKRKKSKIREI